MLLFRAMKTTLALEKHIVAVIIKLYGCVMLSMIDDMTNLFIVLSWELFALVHTIKT